MALHRLRIAPPVAILAAALFALSPLVHADALQDIGRLVKQGQHAQALDKTEQYLASNPKDPQARFLKGLVLTELNRQQEAIVVFTKLTEEFPESPEPYNNLAVIYAQQKQYDKARQALEMAIRTHPSYATAHENLGDIYAHMASQAYDKALSIDSSNTSAQTKLQMIRDMMTGGRAGTPLVAGGKTPPRPAVATTAPAAQVAAASTPTAAPAPPAATARTETPAPSGGDNAEAASMVEAWADAWSKKNIKAYLAFYAKDFQTPKGESRADWEDQRNKRIVKPGAIQVRVDSIKVALDGPDKATVRFRQHYQSASLKTSGNKTLMLVKRDGKWQIRQELVK